MAIRFSKCVSQATSIEISSILVNALQHDIARFCVASHSFFANTRIHEIIIGSLPYAHVESANLIGARFNDEPTHISISQPASVTRRLAV